MTWGCFVCFFPIFINSSCCSSDELHKIVGYGVSSLTGTFPSLCNGCGSVGGERNDLVLSSSFKLFFFLWVAFLRAKWFCNLVVFCEHPVFMDSRFYFDLKHTNQKLTRLWGKFIFLQTFNNMVITDVLNHFHLYVSFSVINECLNRLRKFWPCERVIVCLNTAQ